MQDFPNAALTEPLDDAIVRHQVREAVVIHILQVLLEHRGLGEAMRRRSPVGAERERGRIDRELGPIVARYEELDAAKNP